MSGPNIQQPYAVFGTPASPVTLTALFSDNVGPAIFCRYMRRFYIEGVYTPSANNSFLEVLVEYSNDDPAIYPNGLPTNWRPLTVQVAATTEVDVYANQGTDMGTASGIPLIFPGSKATTANRAVKWEEDMTDIVAFWIRFSLREHTASTFGTTDMEVTLQN